MIPIAYYLLKVIIISGLLFGYYHFALRNKLFHQWNRFYLLASVALSLTMPLMSIPVTTTEQHGSKIFTALQVVSGADEYISSYQAKPVNFISAETILALLFTLVSLVMSGILFIAVIRILRLIRIYEKMKLDDIFFINTSEPGTPFSYFRYIFWNEEIDINTDNGRRIFEHELVHVRENHSLDKLFIQAILIFCWINPFFWLIRSELGIIHEFIADKKSIGEKDSAAFAELILQTAYPNYQHLITNPFFQSSIKRRLIMITKSKHPGMNYLSRISALIVAICLLLAFTLKPRMTQSLLPFAKLEKKITVVIDAGHGGEDHGSNDGDLTEKNINLLLARQVKAMNNNQQLEIILTRETDRGISLEERVKMVTNKKADLFISIHTNAASRLKTGSQSEENNESGIEAFVSKKNTKFDEGNLRLASILLQNLSSVYTTNPAVKTPETGVYVLDYSSSPAVILECGYITNKKDMAFISDPANQKRIAENILKSIEQYFSPLVYIEKPDANNSMAGNAGNMKDTLPKKGNTVTATTKNIKSNVNSTNNISIDTNINSQINKSVNANIKTTVNTNVNTTVNANVNASVNANVNSSVNTNIVAPVVETISVTSPVPVIKPEKPKPAPLYVVDGKIVSETTTDSINPEKIDRVEILKGESATKVYGVSGKNGVVLITTKK